MVNKADVESAPGQLPDSYLDVVLGLRLEYKVYLLILMVLTAFPPIRARLAEAATRRKRMSKSPEPWQRPQLASSRKAAKAGLN